MRNLACKYIDLVYKKIQGRYYGISCTEEPKPWGSWYYFSISECDKPSCKIPSVEDFPFCPIQSFNCQITITDVTQGPSCQVMTLTTFTPGSNITNPIPPLPNASGPWINDQEAAANGVAIGQDYYLAINNTYGIPVGSGGIRKTRTE